MIRIGDSNLYVGTDGDHALVANDPDWAVVNTAQTIHYIYNGWNFKDRKPTKDDPHYLVMERGQLISANLVDGGAFYYQMFGPQGFSQLLDFIDNWLPTKNVLVNCNLGQSRSPTIVLLHMAKRQGTLPNDSFASAAKAFAQIYPGYQPSGIAEFVATHWAAIV